MNYIIIYNKEMADNAADRNNGNFIGCKSD